MSNPGQQPISFKTVPGRNRTQKWTQAKTNNYDGDDWGGYDDYDDYGYDESSRQGSGQYGQQLQRQSSFDRGVDAERRQFSAGSAAYGQDRYTSPVIGSENLHEGNASPDEARRRMREFSNPGQVPQPLSTPRSPQAPGGAERPPRKSSLGSSMSPPPDARPIPAATTSPSADKPLPFVRPSDIYKRMAEEQHKERQSLDSGRPSLDATQRDAGCPSLAQHGLAHKSSQDNLSSGSGPRSGLDPVSESREAKPASFESPTIGSQETSAPPMQIAQPTSPASTHSSSQHLHAQEAGPRLPPVSRVSDFGSFMPRNQEEERVSATGLAASTAAANAAASALASGSRDVTPTMPSHQFQAQSNDPAAEISAERSSNAPVESVGRSAGEDPSGLSHQPSSGFRSVVHKAFDSQGDGSTPNSPISRDNTQSVVSRSDTNSTRSISPIMSRVPSAATAQQKQQERDMAVPSIAEETPLEVARSRPSADGSNSGISSRQSILRKPTPSHSRNVSSEVAGFTPGYRRSMETPSPNNSPARTPGIEDANTRRFSGPMAAETVTSAEPPDVSPEAPEMPSATLEPAETPLETPDPTHEAVTETAKPLPTVGRGRSGTDYSVRESDLAREATTSPEQRESVAEAASNSQKLFLDTHPSNPGSPTALSPTSGIMRPFPHPATSESGRSSPIGPSRSRVRNIVDQYHQIDEDSRRNSAASGMSSKSSWSNFAGDDDVPPGPVRRTTGGSMLSQETPGSPSEAAMFPSYDRAGSDAAPASSAVPTTSSPRRPEAERQESFRPHLPGEWVSATATPASEVPEAPASRGRDITPASPPTPKGQQVAGPDEEIDLTPTTRKTKLRESDPSMDVEGREDPASAAKNAGDALGTALMSHSGYGHQTQDFASQGTAAPVDVPEMQPHLERGNINDLAVPHLARQHSDAPSDSTSSVANSIPPSPPKTTSQSPGLGANTGAGQERPISNYFAGYGPDAPAPLSFGKSSPGTTHDFESNRPAMVPTLSTDTGAADYESDRLRKDIVRSLGPEQMARLKEESALEDAQRTQTALDAPSNERRVASGESALPPAEVKNSDARSGLPSQSRPGLLGKRFSWENRSADGDDVDQHMAAVGETKGDENRESYGRPDSNHDLHVVNAEVAADSEPTTAQEEKPQFMLNEPADAEKRLSTSLPIGTEALALSAQSTAVSGNTPASIAENQESTRYGLDHVDPSPVAEDDISGDPTSTKAPIKGASQAATSTTTSAQQSASVAQGKIPAFRDLAAIKSTPDRIAAYESTRNRFADMNTGLQGWISGMLTAHPEYANAGNQKYEGPAAIQTTGLGNTISGLGGTIRSHGHKHSPSILKIGGGERKASTTSTTTATAPESGSGNGGGGHVDVEKMQAKGKDFMKSAGAGAKGLFAKGKSRFGRGGEKASISSPLSATVAPAAAAAAAPVTAKPTSSSSREPRPVQTPSRPITPIDLQSDEVMTSDRAPVAATNERRRSVFGRLRDVSRSQSRSRPGSMVLTSDAGRKSPGPSRSVSRAASFIFGRGDATPESAAAAATPAPVVAPAEPAPAVSSPGVLPDPADRRKEAWEDDDAEVGDSGWRDHNGRLGVLPSPSIQESNGPTSPNGRKGSWIGEPVVEPLEEMKGEEDAAASADKGSPKGKSVDKEQMPSPAPEVPAVGQSEPMPAQQQTSEPMVAAPLTTERSVSPLPVESGSHPGQPSAPLERVEDRAQWPRHVQTRSASYAAPSSVATRPQPERKFSALDELPSQQRRRQFTPVATPRRLSLADDGTFAPQLPPGAQQDGIIEDDLSSANAHPVAKAKIPRPPTPAKWDLLSAVPAANVADDAVSGRSSVSSLEDPKKLANDVPTDMSAQRQSTAGVPPMDIPPLGEKDDESRSVSPLPASEPTLSSVVPSGMQGGEATSEDEFKNRPYLADREPGSRPMSYVPLSTESSGMMGQDPIAVAQPKRYSTPSSLAEYTTSGAAPHSQPPSQPVSRAPSLGHPPKEYDRLRSPQPGDEEPLPADTSSKRSSGFFRGADIPPAFAPGNIPSPSYVDDNYNGLEDPQVSEIAEDINKAEQPQKQPRRKSGIMETLRRASTVSMTGSRPSSRGAATQIAAANASEVATPLKSKTLQKLKREPSSAVEPKKKRFSSIGSIFRRSSVQTDPRGGNRESANAGAQPNAQATASPKNQAAPVAAPKPPKKLQKAQPSSSRQQLQVTPQPYYPVAAPPPANYVDYEAMMRHQAPPGHGQQLRHQYWQQPGHPDPAVVSSPYQQAAPVGGYYQPPPWEYYQQGPPVSQYPQFEHSAPNSRTQSLDQPTQPAQPSPMPPMRRLHSEGHRRRDTVPDIPESVSPVSSTHEQSTTQPPAMEQTSSYPSAGGASHHEQPGTARPPMNRRQSSNYSQASMMRTSSIRHAPDNFPQAAGRQDYQTPYWHYQNQPPRVASPVSSSQMQAQYRPQASNVGSIDQQIAISHGNEYHDHQTPWSVNLPQGQEGSNRNSWAMQPSTRSPHERYMGPPAAARGAIRSSSPPQPYQDQYSSMTPYHFVPPQQWQASPPQPQQQPYAPDSRASSPATYIPTSPQDRRQTPSQYYPEGAYGPPYQQKTYSAQPRYYNQQSPRYGNPQRSSSYDTQPARPLSHQRTPSGFSGRRDDAAVSEAELLGMRGTSY